MVVFGPRGEPKNRRATVFVLVMTVVISGLLAVRARWAAITAFLNEPEEYRFINPLGDSGEKQESEKTIRPSPPAGLKEEIEQSVAGLQGRYGIYFEDLESGGTVNVNGDEIYDAASVVKVVTMVVAYQMVSAGTLSLEDEYVLRPEDVQDYGTGSMRYAAVGTRYTYRELLRLAGKQSDNTADYVLRQKIGEQAISRFLAEQKMLDTDMNQVQSTPHEISELLIKIYEGKILSPKYREMLYDNLSDTLYEDRIKKGLPAEVRVIHKIGNGVNRAYNDCGIILAPRPFVLCIMNQDASQSEAMSAIPYITNLAFEWSIKESR